MSEINIAILALSFAAVGAAMWALSYYIFYAVQSQILGETVWHGLANENSVAFTFDDGPSPETENLLDVLKAENVRATFFLLGKNVEKYPETVRRIVRENHEIGNHSFSHPVFLFTGSRRTQRELEQTQQIIEKTAGVIPKISRPPYGVRSYAYFSAAKKTGFANDSMERYGIRLEKFNG